MPKIVDHDQRRGELVAATWRIIARHGIEHATMREIAAEAGFANGALKPYFPTKEDLLTSAFAHVFHRTNERITAELDGKRGLAALVTLWREVLPLDEERVQEARIVIPFWQQALSDPTKAALHERWLGQWRTAIIGYLRQARQLGEVTTTLTDADVADHLVGLMLGAQVRATLSAESNMAGRLVGQLESYLRLLGPGRQDPEGVIRG